MTRIALTTLKVCLLAALVSLPIHAADNTGAAVPPAKTEAPLPGDTPAAAEHVKPAAKAGKHGKHGKRVATKSASSKHAGKHHKAAGKHSAKASKKSLKKHKK